MADNMPNTVADEHAAKAKAAQYLRTEGLLPNGQELAEQVAKQPIEFFDGSLDQWAAALAKADTAKAQAAYDAAADEDGVARRTAGRRNPDFARAPGTEAVTFPGQSGQPQILVAGRLNGRPNYTMPTVVHELFHTVEHPKIHRAVGRNTKNYPIVLSAEAIEAITEYFARLAAAPPNGMEVRYSVNGKTCYQEDITRLRAAMQRGITHEMLVKAYFMADAAAISRIDEEWLREGC